MMKKAPKSNWLSSYITSGFACFAVHACLSCGSLAGSLGIACAVYVPSPGYCRPCFAILVSFLPQTLDIMFHSTIHSCSHFY